MNKIKPKNGWWTILFVAVIFFLSFRAYAPFLTPRLNSDHAVHVLMASDLKLPNDLYYWGQNRLGSLVPILGHGLLKIVPMRSIEAVSFVQYGLLLVGYLCFASLLQKTLAKLLLALVWFLPLVYFNEFVAIGQPYAAQFACLGLATVLFNSIMTAPDPLRSPYQQLRLSGGVACLFLALWVSDFTIVMLLLLGLAAGFYGYRSHSSSTATPWAVPILRRSKFISILNVATLSIVGISLIHYAKSHSSGRVNYASLNTLVQLSEVIQKLLQALGEMLTFQAGNFFASVQSIIAMAVLAYLVFNLLRSRYRSRQSLWFYLFFANAILGFFALLIANYVYINQVNLRYFIPIYLLIWLTVLLFFDRLPKSDAKKLGILLMIAALATSFSSPAYVFGFSKSVPRIQRLEALESLGQAGFIGDYWTAYFMCSANPQKFSCTPFDRRGSMTCSASLNSSMSSHHRKLKHLRLVRCPRCATRVLRSKQIYLIQEQWLDQFPNEIEQFGQCLRKSGQSIRRGNYTIAPYTLRDHPQ